MDIQSITEFISHLPDWTNYIVLLIGVIFCFFGYKVMKGWITLFGFFIGWLVVYGITEQYVNQLSIAIVAGTIAGLITGFIAYRIYLLGVFVSMLLTVIGIAVNIPMEEDLPQIFVRVGGVVVGILLGFLAVKFVRPVLIFSTGVYGAALVAVEIWRIFKMELDGYTLIVGGILLVIGIAIQFQTTHKNDDKRKQQR